MKLTQETLKKLLNYDPETGVFTWKVHLSNINSGCVAGTIGDEGYRRIKINYKHYQAHRLAFLFITGKFPLIEIDHKNHIRDDNRWENIRQADRLLNARNRSLSRNNTSGINGITWNKKNKRWIAYIGLGITGARKYLGSFKNINDALYARKSAEILYQYDIY